MRIALSTAPLSFDPHATDEIVAFIINANIYETLVTTDRDLNPQPGLAASWFNPDPRTWTFDLGPGLRFQDGSPLTSADVASSLLRARSDPQSEWGGGLLAIDSIETPSASRVVVRTRAPDATLIQTLAQTLIVPRWAGPIASSSLKVHPVGSGPYRLESWEPGAGRVSLLAWEGYARGRPSVARVVFRAIPDDRQRVASLLSGEEDLIGDLPPELAPTVARSPSAEVLEAAGLMEIYLVFDVQRAHSPYASPSRNPFLDPRVRRAFLAAIDRDRFVREVLLGSGEVADQVVAPSVFGFDPSLPRRPFDPGLARRLLEEAGFAGGFSVVLDAPDSSYVGDRRLGPYVARALGDIGVQVHLRSLRKADLFERQAKRDTSLSVAGWNCASGDMQEVLDFLLHTSDQARGYGRENSGGYSNAKLDRLAERAHETFGRETRIELLRAAARILAEDVPWVPIYVARERYGAARSLRFAPRPDRLIPAATLSFSRSARATDLQPNRE